MDAVVPFVGIESLRRRVTRGLERLVYLVPCIMDKV